MVLLFIRASLAILSHTRTAVKAAGVALEGSNPELSAAYKASVSYPSQVEEVDDSAGADSGEVEIEPEEEVVDGDEVEGGHN